MEVTDPDLLKLRERLGPVLWEKRWKLAIHEAEEMEKVLALMESEGLSGRKAVSRVFPEQRPDSAVRRLRRYQSGGVENLVERRFVQPAIRMTERVQDLVRALLRVNPELRAKLLCDAVQEALGHSVSVTTMREWLREEGLAHPVGRPSGASDVGRTALPLAGAELLKALDEKIGATAAVTSAIGAELANLEPCEGPVRDDREGRDADGRFTAAYNDRQRQTDDSADLDPRFRSVEECREGKDLAAMRATTTSEGSRAMKDRALIYLPMVVEGARWSELGHWRGAHLHTLVGHAFQPSTLDKYARELKYAGVSAVAQGAVASFWFEREPESTGMVVLYCDGFTKPIWTRHYTKSTKVSRTGRIQPGITTFFLHSGAGTPLLFESHSGTSALTQRLSEVLREWESVAGTGTAQRLVVVDRGAQSVALMRELDEAGWKYILPVKRESSPPERWSQYGEWVPLDPNNPTGPAIRDGRLDLNDSTRPGEPCSVRGLGRRRDDADDPGGTWVTNVSPEEMTSSELLERYSARWPLQEHGFRDANGRVGLHRHYGYGKCLVDNVAVLTQLEKLEAQQARLQERIASLQERSGALEQAVKERERRLHDGEDWPKVLTEELKAQVTNPGDDKPSDLLETMDLIHSWHASHPSAIKAHDRAVSELNEHKAKLARAEQRVQDKIVERANLEKKTSIYQVDTELDSLILAYKLTFINLCRELMKDYLGVNWQLDSLIQAVLTLPGRRKRTRSHEYIEIFRQDRDPRAMVAVARACERMNALEIKREGRVLDFRLIQGQ